MVHLSETTISTLELFGAHGLDTTVSVADLISALNSIHDTDSLMITVSVEHLPDTSGYPAELDEDEEVFGETEEPIEGAPHPADGGDDFTPAHEPVPVKERKKRTTKAKV